jgi:hypothetical protein
VLLCSISEAYPKGPIITDAMSIGPIVSPMKSREKRERKFFCFTRLFYSSSVTITSAACTKENGISTLIASAVCRLIPKIIFSGLYRYTARISTFQYQVRNGGSLCPGFMMNNAICHQNAIFDLGHTRGRNR